MTELGNRLKEARETKGISLDELQEITKIQKRYLIGIEEGNYSIMPGKFYIRAFIKQYAEAVDLHPEEIFELYKEDVPSVVNTELPDLSRVKSRKTISDGNSKLLDAIPKLLIAIFLLGAAGLIYYLLQENAGDKANKDTNNGAESVKYEVDNDIKNNDNKNNKSTEEKTDKEDETEDNQADKSDENTVVNPDDNSTEDGTTEELESGNQEVTVVESSGHKTIYELKKSDRLDLKLVSTGETWVNMKNDKGSSLFQGMLKKGEVESQTVDYSKENEAVLVIGNSVNTEIYINEQKIEYAISPSEEVRQDIVIRFISDQE